MKLCGCRFLYFFSLCDVRNEAVFLLLEHSSPRGVKQEKHVKKREILGFKPLLQEIRLKNLTGRRFSEVLTSKLWNKKNTYFWSLPKWSEFELYSPPYGFIKNLPHTLPAHKHTHTHTHTHTRTHALNLDFSSNYGEHSPLFMLEFTFYNIMLYLLFYVLLVYQLHFRFKF